MGKMFLCLHYSYLISKNSTFHLTFVISTKKCISYWRKQVLGRFYCIYIWKLLSSKKPNIRDTNMEFDTTKMLFKILHWMLLLSQKQVNCDVSKIDFFVTFIAFVGKEKLQDIYIIQLRISEMFD